MPLKKFKNGRIFIIECVSPIDSLSNTNEGESLKNICDQVGHQTALFKVSNLPEFRRVCKYIGSMDQYEDSEDNKTLFIHLSMHGSKAGLAFGGEDLKWKDLYRYVQPICKMKYSGAKIFTISSCYGINQQLSKSIEKIFKSTEDFSPPKYLFVPSSNTIYWSDAIVSWIILFHQLPEIAISDNKKVQRILDTIYKLGLGKLRYYRWVAADEKYRQYTAKT
jgi:hypothetical protein